MKYIILLICGIFAVMAGWITIPEDVQKAAGNLFEVAKKVDIDVTVKLKDTKK